MADEPIGVPGNGFDVSFDPDALWPDLQNIDKAGNLYVIYDRIVPAGTLAKGTASGDVVVALRFDLPDGKTLLFQTTRKAWNALNMVMDGKYGPIEPERNDP